MTPLKPVIEVRVYGLVHKEIVRLEAPSMKITPESLHRGVFFALVSMLAATVLTGVIPSSGVAGAVGHAGSRATATSTTLTHEAQAQAITVGPSRGECFTPDNSSGQLGLASVESLVSSFDELTGTTVNCLSAYLDNTQTWAQWEQPWVIHATVGYSAWVAQQPQARQLVLAVNLIPLSLQNVKNPIHWERACAAGNYNSYATTLGQNLVAAGLQSSVIRLGDEMNGEWEPDFIGTKVVEQRLWAKCFDNEVTGLRRAEGEHFLIDWNPNACWAPYPYRNFYPGNAYVNLLGLDLYDIGCMTPDDPLTFAQLANEQYGLTHFEAFAKAKGKPMSLPEWALNKSPSGDDPAFIAGVGKAFDAGDFAFEAYFDEPSVGSLQLSAGTPLSVVAFQQWFAST